MLIVSYSFKSLGLNIFDRCSLIWVVLLAFPNLFLSNCADYPRQDNGIMHSRDEVLPEASVPWLTQILYQKEKSVVGAWQNMILDETGLMWFAYAELSSPYQLHLTKAVEGNLLSQTVGSAGQLSSIGLARSSDIVYSSYFTGTRLMSVVFNEGQRASVVVEDQGQDSRIGMWSSLVVNSSGHVMISYQSCHYVDPEGGQHWCRDHPGETSRSSHFAVSQDQGRTWSVVPVEKGNYMLSNTGFYTSLALLDDRPLIAYYDRVPKTIRVAHYRGGDLHSDASWHKQNVVMNVWDREDGPSLLSLNTSSKGLVGLAYYDMPKGDLFYVESRDGAKTWQAAQLVDRMGNVGQMPHLVFDSQSRPAIAYYDESDRGQGQGAKIAWRDASGTWHNVSIARGSRLGQFPRLAFDSGGQPVVSFFDGQQGNLLYSKLEKHTWPPEL